MIKIHTNVRIDENDKLAIEKYAKKENRSFSQMIRIILKSWVNKNGKWR